MNYKLKLQKLIKTWKFRQTCNNQPELDNVSKAKAHIYGICAEELKSLIERMNDEKTTERGK